MNLLETLLSAGGGGVVNQLAAQFGVNADQAGSVLSTLAPALAGAMKEKVDSGSASGLSELLAGGGLTQFIDNPSALANPQALETGQSLLNMIFGGGDLSQLIAGVAEKAGISGGIVNSMLPIATTLLGGFLSKSLRESDTDLSTLLGAVAGEPSGLLGAVKGLAAKIFG
jgi:hypothetical protein